MKELSQEQIPKGFKYAAVNKNTTAFISTHKPTLNTKNECWTTKKGRVHYIGTDYNNTEWNKKILKKN